jgi:hypothetical protein
MIATADPALKRRAIFVSSRWDSLTGTIWLVFVPVRARSLDSLEKARVFGMTPEEGDGTT